MKNSMIVHRESGAKEFFTCPTCRIDYLNGEMPCDEVIPVFYSERHAFDGGWRKTTHHRFSKNGRPIWVCPECWPGDA